MTTVAYLRLRDVVKSYDGKSNAVDDISIDIERGEFITFLGPSGSGKTTTLMMIAGFEHPNSGSIELDGSDLTLSKPYDRNIGMVFQNYALFPHMTAAQERLVSAADARLSPAPSSRREHERDAGPCGLEGVWRSLSARALRRTAAASGTRPRTGLQSRVLLLDEPLGALDKNLREQMQVEIKRIHREVGITMIYVTHDQTEAMSMSDRIAVFSNGRLKQVGSPLEVYHRPANSLCRRVRWRQQLSSRPYRSSQPAVDRD